MKKYIFHFIIIIGIAISGLIYIGSLKEDEQALDTQKVTNTNKALAQNLAIERGWALGTYDKDGNALPNGQTTSISDTYSWALPISKVYVDGKTHELVIIISNDSLETLNKDSLLDTINTEQKSAWAVLSSNDSSSVKYKVDEQFLKDLGGSSETSDTGNYEPRARVENENRKVIAKSSSPNLIGSSDITDKKH